MPEELPPPLDEPDAMDDYWFEKTTITVDRWCKVQLDHERNGQPWNEYLEELRQAKADPVTLSDAEAIADAIEDELSMANGPGVDVDVPGLMEKVDKLAATPVQLEATEYGKIAEAVEDRLR